MNDGQRKCSDCGGNMVEGFTIDTRHLTSFLPKWYQGTPEIRRDRNNDLKIGSAADVPSCPIVTFRCESCGLLKFYGAGDLEPSYV